MNEEPVGENPSTPGHGHDAADAAQPKSSAHNEQSAEESHTPEFEGNQKAVTPERAGRGKNVAASSLIALALTACAHALKSNAATSAMHGQQDIVHEDQKIGGVQYFPLEDEITDSTIASFYQAQQTKEAFDLYAANSDCSSCGRYPSGPTYSSPRTLRYPSTNRYSSGSSCFVATAVFKDRESYEVKTLVEFRDRTLQQYALGRCFIRWYYRHGPGLARFVEPRPGVSQCVRGLLRQVVKMLSHA